MLILLLLLPGTLWLYFKRRKPPVTKEQQQPLSVQEQKIVDQLSGGLSNEEISSELNIEISTVKSHIHRIYNKLGVKSRKELYGRH